MYDASSTFDHKLNRKSLKEMKQDNSTPQSQKIVKKKVSSNIINLGLHEKALLNPNYYETGRKSNKKLKR